MTKLRFGAAAGAGGPFGIAFAPTHRDDQVEAALRGYFPAGELEQLARRVGEAGYRRMRKGKAPGRLHDLSRLLAVASRPPVVPVAMRWFTSPEGGDPLVCVLVTGEQAGQTVTTVPPGVQFRFADPESIESGQVFCQPVDDQGGDLGPRAWHLDSGDRVRVAGGTYLVPFDAIRTGNAADVERPGTCEGGC